MNDFTLTRIKNTQVNSFLDTCIIRASGSSTNSYKELLYTFTDGSPISCGFKNNTASKTYGESETRLKYDSIFRIDANNTITEKDQIKLTKISGSAISAITFNVQTITLGHGIYVIGANRVEV